MTCSLFSMVCWLAALIGLIVAATHDEIDYLHQGKKAAKSPSELLAENYKRQFEMAGRKGLPELTKSNDESLSIAATWELHKQIIPKPAKAKGVGEDTLIYDPAGVRRFLAFLGESVKAPVPEWWSGEILDLHVRKGECHLNPSNEKKPSLKVIDFENKKWYIPDGVAIDSDKKSLFLKRGDLSFPYPLNLAPFAPNAVAQCFNDKCSAFAIYKSTGGMPYNLVVFDNSTIKQSWTSNVWAMDKQFVAGASAGHRVEMAASDKYVFVFGAELWGLYIEAFDIATGKCRFRFCTSYWGHYSEKWTIR